MFSEYASRFLAQSQSRVGFRPDDAHRTEQDRRRKALPASKAGAFRQPASRSYLHRALGNPYQPASSQASHFPFASRTSAQPAPLFFSATDEFREDDDEQEREREIADFYALQRSRRHFGASNMEESSELDDDGDEKSSEASGDGMVGAGAGFGRGGGIRSSWRGGKVSARTRNGLDIMTESLPEQAEPDQDRKSEDSRSPISSKGKDRMVDIGLEDTWRSDRGEPPEFVDEDPPSIQQFRKQPRTLKSNHLDGSSSFMPRETDQQALLDHPRPPSSSGSSVPPLMSHTEPEPPLHDAFWGNLFLIALAGLLATAFLVFLHTSAPGGKPIPGDTIYNTLHASFFLLGVYTLVAILVSLLWLALLRSYVRPLVYTIVVAVPVVLYAFALYPFISSFKGSYDGASVQDKIMRWGSIVPAVIATLWIYSVFQGRHSTAKAISILEFACRILAANPALLALGLVTLTLVVSWTWCWMLMFTRIFLGGHLSKSKVKFIIDLGSWWLGVLFILVYIWSLGVIAGIQRATTAATVSQWYFHRLAVPTPSSRQIVQAALVHATTTLFGTVCLSTLLAMLIRLPLIVLPRRLASLITLFAYSLVPTPIAALANPLTLTYAAIHSQPLSVSARGLSQMTFLAPTAATSLHPRAFSRSPRNSAPLLPYRLAKVLLHATRFMMSLALGFGGWVSTARSLQVSQGGSTIRGSLYAYVVGLIAGAIGWGVLGAMEGVLASVVDAAVVCWGSEVGASGKEARYCREADWLFGGVVPEGHTIWPQSDNV